MGKSEGVASLKTIRSSKKEKRKDKEKKPLSKDAQRLEKTKQQFKKDLGPDAPVNDTMSRRRRERLEAAYAVREELSKELAAEYLFNHEDEGGLMVEDVEDDTLKVTQDEILRQVDIGTARKALCLELKSGPYITDFSLDGRHMIVASQSGGEAALIDTFNNTPLCSVFPNETIRAAKVCYNEQAWALAQKKYVNIYNKQGVQIHCFKQELNVKALEYLPYHFLLVSLGKELAWRDLSDGRIVGWQELKRRPTGIMRQNPFTGVIYVGNCDGTVDLWTPSHKQPVLNFLAHPSAIASLVPFNNHYVATAGNDGIARIFDIRNPIGPLSACRLQSTGSITMDCSGAGILAIGRGCVVDLWKDVHNCSDSISLLSKRYMTHQFQGGDRINSLRFQPFEDILSVGHSNGVQNLIIPGCGIASPDMYEENPYATTKEKARRLVGRLMDKLQPDTILLDPSKFGRIG